MGLLNFVITSASNELNQSRAMMSHNFKIISHFLLDKTHLITDSSNITLMKISRKNGRFRQKKGRLFEVTLYTVKYNPSGSLFNSG